MNTATPKLTTPPPPIKTTGTIAVDRINRMTNGRERGSARSGLDCARGRCRLGTPSVIRPGFTTRGTSCFILDRCLVLVGNPAGQTPRELGIDSTGLPIKPEGTEGPPGSGPPALSWTRSSGERCKSDGEQANTNYRVRAAGLRIGYRQQPRRLFCRRAGSPARGSACDWERGGVGQSRS